MADEARSCFPALTGGPEAAKVISPFFSTAEYSGCCRPSSPAAAFRGAEHGARVKQAFLALCREIRICDLQSYGGQRDVTGLTESCPSLGHSLRDNVADPTQHTLHGARGFVKGSHDVKEITLSFSKLTCPKKWHVLAWLSLPPLCQSLMSTGTSASSSPCGTGPQLMPAQCKQRLQRLFPLMCVTKHTKRIFSLRSSWQQNFFKKTCWCFGFAKDRSCFRAQTKEGWCDGPLLRQKKGKFLFPIFSSC